MKKKDGDEECIQQRWWSTGRWCLERSDTRPLSFLFHALQHAIQVSGEGRHRIDPPSWHLALCVLDGLRRECLDSTCCCCAGYKGPGQHDLDLYWVEGWDYPAERGRSCCAVCSFLVGHHRPTEVSPMIRQPVRLRQERRSIPREGIQIDDFHSEGAPRPKDLNDVRRLRWERRRETSFGRQVRHFEEGRGENGTRAS
jgi:hypothetical protein